MTDDRVTNAVAWIAENRPARGADAVFDAAVDEIVVMRLDRRPEPRTGRVGLVAAAVVVALMTVGVLIALVSRPETPTVGTDDTTTTIEPVAGDGCRVGAACVMPDQPVAIVPPVPAGFRLRAIETSGPGMPAGQMLDRAVGSDRPVVVFEVKPLDPARVPDRTIGSRPALVVTYNTTAFVTYVPLTDRLMLEVTAERIGADKVPPLIEATVIR